MHYAPRAAGGGGCAGGVLRCADASWCWVEGGRSVGSAELHMGWAEPATDDLGFLGVGLPLAGVLDRIGERNTWGAAR